MSVLPLSMRPLVQNSQPTTAVFIAPVEVARVCQVSQDERKRAGEWFLRHVNCGVRCDTHPWLAAASRPSPLKIQLKRGCERSLCSTVREAKRPEVDVHRAAPRMSGNVLSFLIIVLARTTKK
jgi:hypothetical protein